MKDLIGTASDKSIQKNKTPISSKNITARPRINSLLANLAGGGESLSSKDTTVRRGDQTQRTMSNAAGLNGTVPLSEKIRQRFNQQNITKSKFQNEMVRKSITSDKNLTQEDGTVVEINSQGSPELSPDK